MTQLGTTPINFRCTRGEMSFYDVRSKELGATIAGWTRAMIERAMEEAATVTAALGRFASDTPYASRRAGKREDDHKLVSRVQATVTYSTFLEIKGVLQGRRINSSGILFRAILHTAIAEQWTMPLPTALAPHSAIELPFRLVEAYRRQISVETLHDHYLVSLVGFATMDFSFRLNLPGFQAYGEQLRRDIFRATHLFYGAADAEGSTRPRAEMTTVDYSDPASLGHSVGATIGATSIPLPLLLGCMASVHMVRQLALMQGKAS